MTLSLAPPQYGAPYAGPVRRNEADSLESLRRRSSEKWGTFRADVLPMFVAEMDFPLAPEIKAALQEAIEVGDTGYVDPHDTRAAAAFAEFAQDAWGWSPRVHSMGVTTDVSVVIVESLRRPGETARRSSRFTAQR